MSDLLKKNLLNLDKRYPMERMSLERKLVRIIPRVSSKVVVSNKKIVIPSSRLDRPFGKESQRIEDANPKNVVNNKNISKRLSAFSNLTLYQKIEIVVSQDS